MTQIGAARDCVPFHFLLQREFPRRDTVQIPQREEENPQAVISLIVR
jgi:hypothetical protein